MIYRHQTDETLVMLTLAGEQSAYEELVVRHQKAVVAAADSVIHSRFMAEDAAQDAFVTAWMKLNTLQDTAKFGAWVCRIAKNCALNIARRFHNYMPLEMIENISLYGDRNQNPAELYALSEEKEELHKTIGKLPEKVRMIIQLHYFEGLAVSEIAERMSISEGTVKSQLHDGRKRIRKELCAMNEHWNDTLVQRVMKKVEELKLWQYKNSKDGFEKVYKDVLKEVEELPECKDKFHALADVLMRGWWWIPGKKNDALFERIKEAAELGKNEDVMIFIIKREGKHIYGDAKIAFIRDTQIPKLEKTGFTRALAFAWYHLATYCFNENRAEDGIAALKKTIEIVPSSDLYHQVASEVIATHDSIAKYADKNARTYKTMIHSDEFRYVEGKLLRYDEMYFGDGDLYSYDHTIENIFFNASYCDGSFTYDGLAVGETHIGSDGTKLTYESDGETVVTPCGSFDGCKLWVSRHKSVKCSTWYKDGVGIVKQVCVRGGIGETRTLKAYEIKGGNGLVPFCVGNRWEYAADYNPEALEHSSVVTVAYSDSEKVILTHDWNLERLKYDDNSWLDMVRQVRGEYWGYANGKNGKQTLQDVYYPMERAIALAKTDMEKAHAKASASVARRILETDPEFNPDHKATGHWNFFAKLFVYRNDGVICTDSDFQWSFEWKHMDGMGGPDTPLLFNDIYEILGDAARCLWSDDWCIGYSETIEFMLWDEMPVKTVISCTDAGEITTAAGKFENCIKVDLDISKLDAGIEYRGGKKAYYFAKNIGIVRVENEYCDGGKTAVYELASYEGEGEGYMPVKAGLVRRYEALNLTDGYRAGAEYTYAADEEGNIAIFADRTGVRDVMPNITRYDSIYGETQEEVLWEKDWAECRLLHDVNNYKLMMHFLYRKGWNICAPQRNAVWQKYKISLIETFRDENGELPRGWWGFYADVHFAAACTLFGCDTPKEKEEGYEYLEKAFPLYEKWLAIPDGELLEVGSEHIFGGIKLKKGTGMVVLPDGTSEQAFETWLGGLVTNPNRMYYGMTATRGWEWFDPVRNEERFKAYIERADELNKKYK